MTAQKIAAAKLREVGFALSLCLGACAAHACSVIEPIPFIPGVQAYIDPRDSIKDDRLEQLDRSAQEPVREFVAAVAAPLDIPNDGKSEGTDCAYNLLKNWARSSALLAKPSHGSYRDQFQSVILRQQFALSLTILALKLRDRGYELGPDIVAWLKALNDAVLQQRKMLRGNLYAWSGANALAFYFLSPDEAAFDYADAAWRDSIMAIRSDGFVDSELRRGRRALAYHQFYLSALLMLRQLREDAGLDVSPADSRAIEQLNVRVSDGFCNPKPFRDLTGQQQWSPEEWAFRLIWSFGDDLLNDAWRVCGSHPRTIVLATAGGDLTVTKAMLHRLGQRLPDNGSKSALPQP